MAKPTVLVVRVSCPACGEEVDVQWSVTPGDPGVRTFRNGDPGYPPTPAEAAVKASPEQCPECDEPLVANVLWDAELERVNEETDWDEELRHGREIGPEEEA